VNATKNKKILLTAGLGNPNFFEAAERLISDAMKLELFDEIVLLCEENLELLCPTVVTKYHHILNSSTRGFGYMCWKAEIVHAFMKKNEGLCTVVWIDAGCEIVPSVFSKWKLASLMSKSETEGYVAFTLETSELEYTKRELFNEFDSAAESLQGPQFQTTFFALSGQIGMKIASEWFALVASEELFVNEVTHLPQHRDFVQHRHDQSVFSLTLKTMGLSPNLNTPHAGRGNRLKVALTYLMGPIVVARNRCGKSLCPKYVRIANEWSLRAFRKNLPRSTTA
jgi:hypothetical protein